MKDARYFDNGQLVIFRCSDGPIFHLRTKLSGKYVWRSLNTANLEDAIAKAWKLHHGLQAMHERGLPVTAKTFSCVIDEYVHAREKSCKQGKTTPAMLRQVRRVRMARASSALTASTAVNPASSTMSTARMRRTISSSTTSTFVGDVM